MDFMSFRSCSVSIRFSSWYGHSGSLTNGVDPCDSKMQRIGPNSSILLKVRSHPESNNDEWHWWPWMNCLICTIVILFSVCFSLPFFLVQRSMRIILIHIAVLHCIRRGSKMRASQANWWDGKRITNLYPLTPLLIFSASGVSENLMQTFIVVSWVPKLPVQS